MKKIILFMLCFYFFLSIWNAFNDIDINNPKVYNNSEDFLNEEWGICLQATDWCNNISISNWSLWASTMMYCEDIYGENWQEKWSCNNYDQEKFDYIDYIKNNISDLSDVQPVLWGTWYVTDIKWKNDDNISVTYEDWHIEENIILNKDDINIEWEQFICTMEYAPVCAQVKNQCNEYPCFPVQQTFSNSCMAWNNKILYNFECDKYVDIYLYNKYMLSNDVVSDKISNVSTDILNQALELSNTLISRTKMLRIVDTIIKQRVTKYVYLKNMIMEELSKRN